MELFPCSIFLLLKRRGFMKRVFKVFLSMFMVLAMVLSTSVLSFASANEAFSNEQIANEILSGISVDPSYEIVIVDEADAQAYIDYYKSQMDNPRNRNILANILMITISNQGTHARVNFWNIAVDSMDSVTGSITLYSATGLAVGRQTVSETNIWPMTYRQYNVYPAGGSYSGGLISVTARDGSVSAFGSFYF
jgi:hypothetical protein